MSQEQQEHFINRTLGTIMSCGCALSLGLLVLTAVCRFHASPLFQHDLDRLQGALKRKGLAGFIVSGGKRFTAALEDANDASALMTVTLSAPSGPKGNPVPIATLQIGSPILGSSGRILPVAVNYSPAAADQSVRRKFSGLRQLQWYNPATGEFYSAGGLARDLLLPREAP